MRNSTGVLCLRCLVSSSRMTSPSRLSGDGEHWNKVLLTTCNVFIRRAEPQNTEISRCELSPPTTDTSLDTEKGLMEWKVFPFIVQSVWLMKCCCVHPPCIPPSSSPPRHVSCYALVPIHYSSEWGVWTRMGINQLWNRSDISYKYGAAAVSRQFCIQHCAGVGLLITSQPPHGQTVLYDTANTCMLYGVEIGRQYEGNTNT